MKRCKTKEEGKETLCDLENDGRYNSKAGHWSNP